MHLCRLLTKSPTDYPITAQILLHSNLDQLSALITQITHALLYIGISRYGRTRAPKHNKLTRFYFADAGYHSIFPNIHFKSLNTLFTTLTHLDLCISHSRHPNDLHGLRDYIMASKDLTHLRLCLERGNTYYNVDGNLPFTSTVLLGHADFHLPKLRFLHISEMRVCPELLLHIVKSHAKSLTSLRVDDDLPPDILIDLSMISRDEGLRLSELTIIPRSADNYSFIPAHEALIFVNHLIEPHKLIERLRRNAKLYVGHCEPIYDINGWKTMAILDTRRPLSGVLGYSLGDIHLADSENGDKRDTYYRAYRSDFNDELMLKYGDDIEASPASYLDNPRRQPEADMVDRDNESDRASKGEFQATDEAIVSAREHASHIRRLREAPWWMWNTRESVPLYSSMHPDVGPREGGDPTYMWRFQHRNGEVAFGDEPLEFWEDWEGSQAGDSAEATPFGWRPLQLNMIEFQKYKFYQPNANVKPDTAIVPALESSSQKPYNVYFPYNALEDPMRKRRWRACLPVPEKYMREVDEMERSGRFLEIDTDSDEDENEETPRSQAYSLSV
ncbi:hypothetical protein AAE478_010299 [Parahypoxylon ruwenzoriense]